MAQLLLVLLAVAAQVCHVLRVLGQQLFKSVVGFFMAAVQLKVAKQQAFQLDLNLLQLGRCPRAGNAFFQFFGQPLQQRVLRADGA